MIDVDKDNDDDYEEDDDNNNINVTSYLCILLNDANLEVMLN
jgi:hypothetical protein